MLSRALSLATVMLLIGLSAESARAQNLEAGKSPAQIFASTCTVCHKSPRGLLKSVPAGSLPGFLRQHYTTSSDMAGVLASYLIANGANDPRYQAKDQPRGAKGRRDGRQETNPSPEQSSERPARRPHQRATSQEGAKPDADGLTPQTEGRPSRHKLGRRGKPAEEKPDAAATGEDSKAPAAAKGETEAPAKSVDLPKGGAGSEPAATRADPVPSVTPASPGPAPAVSAPPPPPPPVSSGSAGPPDAPTSK